MQRIQFIYFFILISLFLNTSNAFALDDDVCPLCTHEGKLTCPVGYQAICENEPIEPKCVFLENKYVAGCWKFIGIKKLDFDFNSIDFPPSLMIEVIGGGETYTLNRETIGCRKL